MANIQAARRALVARILEGEGTAPRAQRRAAFENAGLEEPVLTLARKGSERAHSVTDEDIARARQAGLSEDQVFELVVCAAVGQATRQFDSAFAALEAATAKD
jgi:hypothetical protein